MSKNSTKNPDLEITLIIPRTSMHELVYGASERATVRVVSAATNATIGRVARVALKRIPATEYAILVAKRALGLLVFAGALAACGDNAQPDASPDASPPTCHVTGDSPDPCDVAFPNAGLTDVVCDPGVDLRHPPTDFGDCYEGDGLVCCKVGS